MSFMNNLPKTLLDKIAQANPKIQQDMPEAVKRRPVAPAKEEGVTKKIKSKLKRERKLVERAELKKESDPVTKPVKPTISGKTATRREKELGARGTCVRKGRAKGCGAGNPSKDKSFKKKQYVPKAHVPREVMDKPWKNHLSPLLAPTEAKEPAGSKPKKDKPVKKAMTYSKTAKMRKLPAGSRKKRKPTEPVPNMTRKFLKKERRIARLIAKAKAKEQEYANAA